jgi:hypothetical protein
VRGQEKSLKCDKNACVYHNESSSLYRLTWLTQTPQLCGHDTVRRVPIRDEILFHVERGPPISDAVQSKV